jgi:hypothetical protein
MTRGRRVAARGTAYRTVGASRVIHRMPRAPSSVNADEDGGCELSAAGGSTIVAP